MSKSEPAKPVRPGDQARATVTVAVAIDEAFRVFTQEINVWWRRGPRFRNARGPASDQGIICLEPRVDGRVFESYVLNGAETVVEMGRVTEWLPPERLVFRWRASNFASGEHTEVEVQFASLDSGIDRQSQPERKWWSRIVAGPTFAVIIRCATVWRRRSSFA